MGRKCIFTNPAGIFSCCRNNDGVEDGDCDCEEDEHMVHEILSSLKSLLLSSQLANKPLFSTIMLTKDHLVRIQALLTYLLLAPFSLFISC